MCWIFIKSSKIKLLIDLTVSLVKHNLKGRKLVTIYANGKFFYDRKTVAAQARVLNSLMHNARLYY